MGEDEESAGKRVRGKTTQQRYEDQWLQENMPDFDVKTCDAYVYLVQRWPGITREKLVSIGKVIAKDLKIEINREFERRYWTMIKWFQDKWEEVRDFLDHNVKVQVADGSLI